MRAQRAVGFTFIVECVAFLSWEVTFLLGVGGINGVESGPFELQELTKSPYKMYERNPHTKCMREIPTQNV